MDSRIPRRQPPTAAGRASHEEPASQRKQRQPRQQKAQEVHKPDRRIDYGKIADQLDKTSHQAQAAADKDLATNKRDHAAYQLETAIQKLQEQYIEASEHPGDSAKLHRLRKAAVDAIFWKQEHNYWRKELGEEIKASDKVIPSKISAIANVSKEKRKVGKKRVRTATENFVVHNKDKKITLKQIQKALRSCGLPDHFLSGKAAAKGRLTGTT